MENHQLGHTVQHWSSQMLYFFSHMATAAACCRAACRESSGPARRRQSLLAGRAVVGDVHVVTTASLDISSDYLFTCQLYGFC